MDTVRIATEDPNAAQWQRLTRFAYPTNIRRYFESHDSQGVTDETVQFIAGCIRQAAAYSRAAEESPLDISPLLLYYLAVNLMAGACGLLVGHKPAITNHGMALRLPQNAHTRIADVVVAPIDPTSGSLQLFANSFSKRCTLVNGGSWTLEEILGSVPDLKLEYEYCYPNAPPYTIPIEIARRDDVLVERIQPSDLSRYPDVLSALALIPGLEDAYLTPQVGQQMDYVVLYRRMGGGDIGEYSIFGRKHLLLAHVKNGQHLTPNQVILMHMGLFALGHLSRYHPDVWNPFVTSDETGEKLVIEKFLTICHRFLPNLVLNELEEARIQFVHEIEATVDPGNESTR